jgi:hypothetical protein
MVKKTIIIFIYFFVLIGILSCGKDKSQTTEEHVELAKLTEKIKQHREHLKNVLVDFELALINNDMSKAEKLIDDEINAMNNIQNKLLELANKYQEAGNYEYAKGCLILLRDIKKINNTAQLAKSEFLSLKELKQQRGY